VSEKSIPQQQAGLVRRSRTNRRNRVTSMEPAVVPNSLCRGQEKRTMHKPDVQIGNSGLLLLATYFFSSDGVLVATTIYKGIQQNYRRFRYSEALVVSAPTAFVCLSTNNRVFTYLEHVPSGLLKSRSGHELARGI